MSPGAHASKAALDVAFAAVLRGELEDAALLLRRSLLEQGVADGALMIPFAEAMHAVRLGREVGRRLELHDRRLQVSDLTADARFCRVCGCTPLNACEGGCSWVEPDLCSACAPSSDPPQSPSVAQLLARSGLGAELVRAGMQEGYRDAARRLASLRNGHGLTAEARARLDDLHEAFVALGGGSDGR